MKYDVCLNPTTKAITFRNSSTLDSFDGKAECSSETTYTFTAKPDCSGGAQMILYAAPSSSEIIIATNAKGSIEFTDLCKRETEIQLNLIVKAGNSLFQTQGGKPTIRNNGKGLHGFNEPWCYGGWLIAALFLVGVCGYYFWLRKKKNP